jgi:L-asparaginase II
MPAAPKRHRRADAVLVGVVRCGLVESQHPVAVVVMDAAGRIAYASGDADRPFFLRSTAKPFQAAVSQAAGAALDSEELALAAGSHAGQPIHVAMVRAMLGQAGLEERHLVCPPAWPSSEAAYRRAVAGGLREPQPVFHNCSGKHAGMLRACVAQGWPLDYARPSHPIQERAAAAVAEATGERLGPPGVDGCGVSTFRGTVGGLARAYARLAGGPDLSDVAAAMSRFAALTSDGESPQAQLARWLPAAVKGGAEGSLGMALAGGLGLAAKSWSGQGAPAVVAAVAVLDRLGFLSRHAREMLTPVSAPPVLGGGLPVGRIEVLEGM